MNKQLKSYLGAGAMVMSLLVLMPFSAFASNGKEKDHSVTIRPQVEVSQSVDVNNKGAVTLRGTVVSVAAGSMVVKSWGGDWTVLVGADAKINSRANGTIALADIKIGDFVMVHGAMKPNAGLSIQARQVKDHFIPDRSVVLRGTIASIGSNTLTVKSNDTIWTVNTGTTTKFTSKFEVATTLAAMKVGDNVMVKGAVASGAVTTIVASEVKDLSLPLNAVSRVGTIANVVGNAFTLVTKQRNGQDVKVTTDSATAVTVNGKTATSADIKNESRATIQGVLNTDTGVLSAVKVMINDIKGKIRIDDDRNDDKGRR